MKKSFYITLTVISVLVVLYLQGYWMGRSHHLVEQQLARLLHESFFQVSEQFEADTTLSVTDLFRRALDERDLKKINFRIDTITITADYKPTNEEIYFCDYYTLFKEKKTFVFPINNRQGIQAYILNPRAGTVGKLLYYSFSTLIALIILLFGISRQIKIIGQQNRMARIREDFSYAMIHDMKTPLSSILMGTRILRSGKLDGKPEKKEKYFDILEEESQHLLTLTNKVLTISKLEHGQLILEKEEVRLRPILENLIEKFRAKTNKPVTFRLNLQTETIFADEEYIVEAISNLIDNAVKYSQKSIDIQISTYVLGNYVHLKIRDNGLGIPLSEQSLIFDKFERARASHRNPDGKVSGFGLGLNYVMNVTKAHGGYVGVESKEGKYSEFTISLPLPDKTKHHD